MSRVATLPTQIMLNSAIARGQESVANANLELGTFKKVQTYADLGADTRRMLTAATMRAQQQAQKDVSQRVGSTLSLYDLALTGVHDSLNDLSGKLLSAIGQHNGGGVAQAAKEAFDTFRTALNSSEAGVPIFAGGQTETLPFVPKTLADLLTLGSPAAAFANDQTRATAHIDGDTDLSYGITADEVGTGIVEAFQTLAGLGDLPKQLTSAQEDEIGKAIAQINKGLEPLKKANGRNGDLRKHVEGLADSAEQRITLLNGVIGDAVDADVRQVATDLSARSMALNASYAALTKLNTLSLANFLLP
ncbi:hypothetical protein [Sphingomonas sp. RIT328]|uniref:hypothetical protein n=1 Tax=Sphingomonas sp. RIT328 TaxID=1470591 RepID=UPI0004519D10|nr:hypothetical protein [Sphingomonas sp. RIT328]EZP48683.1 Flagellin [Sphingomonas sp. RIT328]